MKWGSGSIHSTSSCIFKWWLVLYCHYIVAYYMYLLTYIALLCSAVTTVRSCKLCTWTVAYSEIQHMQTASYNGWKYSCNNTHHHQWPCYSLFVQAVNVSTTDSSSMHRVWIASREKTFVDSAPSQGGQLLHLPKEDNSSQNRSASIVSLSEMVQLPQQFTH